MSSHSKSTSDSKSKQPSAEEQIINTFKNLRDEQRQIAASLAETELEENELKVVINALQNVDGDRKCYRLIGGVLCKKTVKDVLPVLLEKKDELAKSHTKSKEDLVKKGVEINEFIEKHNIKIQGQEEHAPPAVETESSSTSTGVLS